jgi:hypothetical protein
MEKMISFTHVEKEILPEFRERVNIAESIHDLKNHFSRSMGGMIQRIVGDSVRVTAADITFSPQESDLFTIHPQLLKQIQIHQLLENSDLSQVLNRFAVSLNRRYLHLMKHTDKTRRKIRN